MDNLDFECCVYNNSAEFSSIIKSTFFGFALIFSLGVIGLRWLAMGVYASGLSVLFNDPTAMGDYGDYGERDRSLTPSSWNDVRVPLLSSSAMFSSIVAGT